MNITFRFLLIYSLSGLISLSQAETETTAPPAQQQLNATEIPAAIDKQNIKLNNSAPNVFGFSGASDEDPTNADDSSTLEFLNTPHSIVSGGVEIIAKYMDVFFADEKVYAEATQSYAILSNQYILNEYSDESYAGKLRLKIDLPKTKKKLKLVLESDTEAVQTGIESERRESPTKAATESSYFAALQRELKKHKEWSFFSALGMKLNVPLDPFFRMRASRRFRFNKWNMHFSETLFIFDSLGAGAATIIEFDRKIGEDNLFRSITSATWHNDNDNYDFIQSLNFYHEISKHRAVSLTLEAFGESRPTIHSTSYLAYIRYRQRVHKDWLFLEIRPEVLYERENGFHPTPSLVFQLDMVFGDKYIRRIKKPVDDDEDDIAEN